MLNYPKNIRNNMSKLIKLFIILSLYIPSVFAEYQYQLIEKDGHKIHMVVLDPLEYEASLVASHNQVFGRERIGDIARRENAEIAINAGFFEIGDVQDGRPTGTLVNDGNLFGLRTSKHACFVKNDGKFSVEFLEPNLSIKVADNVVKPSRFNRFARGKRVFFFNQYWGKSTLSAYDSRKEVAIDSNGKIVAIYEHGNSSIPSNGAVVSFPKNADVSYTKAGQKVDLNWSPGYFANKNSFAIMGIPALIVDGKIQDGLSKTTKHARTAIGVKKSGELVVVVAEHVYKSKLSDMTIKDIKKIAESKNLSLTELKVYDVVQAVSNDLSKMGNVVGLTSLELANFMYDQGCVSAINLDGGGSSALYINGQYINQSVGDSDELAGQLVVRPVSDAIIFKRKL